MMFSNKIKQLFAFVLLSFFTVTFTVSAAEDTGAEKDIKTEIKEFIAHHLLDSHDFIFTEKKQEDGTVTYYGFPLPVIFYDQAGLHFMMSSEFEHGHKVVESKGNFYKLYHSKIYQVEDASGVINYDDKHHPVNAKPLDFSITKNVFMMIVTCLLMIWMFSSMAKSYQKNNGVPTGLGRLLEPIVIYVRDEIAIPNIGKNYKKYMSFLLTVFFFVWILNMFGLTPLGVNVTGNIAITACLAIFTYLITTFTANGNYWKHIFWMPGVPVPMKIILAPIELLGTIIKPFSLMIRLYANMAAGHVVLMSIIGLMFIFQSWIGSSLSFFLAFALMILKIFVCALQAYIFTMLSSLYFGAANEEHHHEEHAH